MPIRDKINDWKRYQNALGSESHAEVIVGEISHALGEEMPNEVAVAL